MGLERQDLQAEEPGPQARARDQGKSGSAKKVTTDPRVTLALQVMLVGIVGLWVLFIAAIVVWVWTLVL